MKVSTSNNGKKQFYSRSIKCKTLGSKLLEIYAYRDNWSYITIPPFNPKVCQTLSFKQQDNQCAKAKIQFICTEVRVWQINKASALKDFPFFGWCYFKLVYTSRLKSFLSQSRLWSIQTRGEWLARAWLCLAFASPSTMRTIELSQIVSILFCAGHLERRADVKSPV